MFRFFKILNDDATVETTAVLPVQSSQASATRTENVDGHERLDSLISISMHDGLTVIQHGARLAVVGELLASTLAYLPAAMRADITESFRNRIENLMSLGDERVLPEEFQSALLIEVNRYLNVLR
jgi:hypothetical protein